MFTKRPIALFAAGAALATALTITGLQTWQVGAAPGDIDTTYVPVTPCRLFDLRPAPDNVGPRTSPLGPGETFTTQVTGSNGNCVGIPADATAVAMNVTVLNGTASSFLALFPADEVDVPVVSNLNWTPPQAPTPNKVDVKLSPDGKVKVFNKFGTVDVIADVAGYYTPSSLINLEARVAELEAARPVAVTARKSLESVTAVDEVVVSVTVTAPVAGQVTVFSTSALGDTVAGDETRCTITTGIALETGFLQRWESGGPNTGQHAQLSGVRTFDIAAGATVPYNLVCDHVGAGATSMESTIMSAIFTPGTP